MNKVFMWALVVALAGFLFGFDTIVISGADKSLQELWNSSELFHGSVVMGMALWGTVAGALLGGYPTNRLGRKKTLIGIGFLYLVSAIGSALVSDPYSFAFFRFIGGLGVGASTIAAPAYLSEIAPADRRGRLVAMYQLSIVLGILVAFLSNFLLSGLGENAWRYMLGAEAIPALIYCLLILLIPRSPRWLVLSGKEMEAKEVWSKLGVVGVDNRMVKLKEGKNKASETIFSPAYRPALMAVILIAFFNQFSGINAVMYYGPRIFEEAGLAEKSAFLSSVGIGVTNLIFTLLGMALIDRVGRKTLMVIGSVGYIVSLSLVALSFLLGWSGLAVPLFLFLFIASHAVGQGTVIWVFIAELFPNHLRASGQAMGSTVHWILAAFIPSLIPVGMATIGAGSVFALFAIMMVGQWMWVSRSMPETKGKSLEEISAELAHK
ncbi:sugar porter family MFS transporter [bacterium SCSIO 12741]|nr:sugar porter family MFS transporter [bacterium SCSIO 12741]